MTTRVRCARWLAVLCAAYLLASAISGARLAEMALHPARLPLRHQAEARQAAASFGGTLDDVQIAAADGAVLRAWFVTPKDWNGAAVLLFHGVGDNREGMAGYAEMFLRRGYSVLLPDARAHGESGGTLATYGLLEAEDTHRWVDWIESREYPKCVYGFGESMGAGMVLQSLAVEKRFCAVVAESGFATFREAAYEHVAADLRTKPWVAETVFRPSIAFAFLYARFRYGIDLRRVSPESAVADSTTPVLLIHGTADTTLYPRNSEEIAARAPRVRLWEPAGAGHCGAVNAAPAEFQQRVFAEFALSAPTPGPRQALQPPATSAPKTGK